MHELHRAALEIRILIAIATKWSGRCLEQRLQAQGIAMSSLQYGIMRLLFHERHTISELSRKMTLAPATLVPAVDALERHGFVERGRDPKDRRRTPLALTEQGGAILALVPPVDDEDVLVRSLAAMGPEHSRQLLDRLRDLVAAMPDGAGAVAELAASVNRAD
ncbi:MAG: MarR family transcriptional regulator [Kouleothrix sp.]|nr:MarR family transcriptional regulator [Kouleothrix sp.]